MELQPISTPSVTTASVTSARQAQVQAQTAVSGSDSAVANTVSNTALVDSTRTQTVQKNERPAAQNADQSTLNNANASILFEYTDGQQVMKVNDNKGDLIYQVPPKGQLQLIREQENTAQLLQTQA